MLWRASSGWPHWTTQRSRPCSIWRAPRRTARATARRPRSAASWPDSPLGGGSRRDARARARLHRRGDRGSGGGRRERNAKAIRPGHGRRGRAALGRRRAALSRAGRPGRGRRGRRQGDGLPHRALEQLRRRLRAPGQGRRRPHPARHERRVHREDDRRQGRARSSTRASACAACRQIQNTYSPDRVKYPYKRVGERGSGRWERISWDEATSTIAEKFKEIQAKHGKKSVWIAPYTGSLSIIEGVVGAGFRFASAIGASAGDFEGDNEGDSATPAGWNYVLADPDATAGGIFDGHEMTDFLNSKVIVLWANNVAETSIPDWRIIADAQKQGDDGRLDRPALHADLGALGRLAADQAGRGHGPDRRRHQLRPAAQALRRRVPEGVHGRAVPRRRGDEEVPTQGQVVPRRRRRRRHGQAGRAGEGPGPVRRGATAPRRRSKLLADEMAQYTPEKVASMTDLEPRQVLQLAELWTKNSPVGVRAGFALSHWYRGDLTMQALLTLQALTGNIGVHGGGVTTFAGGLHDDGVRPRQLVGAEGHGDVHRARADGGLRRDARRQAVSGAGRLVHGRQLRAADVRPEQGREGAEVARLPRRLRLRDVGDRRPGGHRPAGVHVPREERPALLEQLLPPVHAEGDRPALGVEVRPRGDHARRRRRWASASTSTRAPTST